ncbi:HAMP domain-containing histidine kinase [Anaerovorax odorimutans]|uniref:histidine kinase n=1 Tax=Anaerovorax odorimutans TaxID=109327 RepID=A0ABT1RQZ5_9FIRM|nr:HAMP domain-containing sensor histidine kinase [Anaerovorax odorimutans]MCQ4637316.1 HAMP domain-containing histidine kinase [Anaerovorax odorimutans]
MSSALKLIRRFILILLLSICLLFVFNAVLLFYLSYHQTGNAGGWKAAQAVSDALTADGNGTYQLSREGASVLEEYQAWAILIDDNGGNVVWHSDNLPGAVPLAYSASDIAQAVRGYICDYPTTTGSHGGDLLIMGHPKTAYWKLMWNTFDYNTIAKLPQHVLVFIICNLAAIFLIYMIASSGIFRSVKPILCGIEALPQGEDIYLKEKGLLSDLAASINRVSEKLSAQNRQLRKKETARANWIAGVSHDIRTPLSMVMGYAGQLEEDTALSQEARCKAAVIRRQSEKIRNLVSDLNLASKLEYNMQPLKLSKVSMTSLVRQVSADFLNMDLEEKYPIIWETTENLPACFVLGDKELLRRAITNIIQNSINHNDEGCGIYVSLAENSGQCEIILEDDGIGASDARIEELNDKPHYMVCDDSITRQRHGLGLLLVKQIIAAHQGSVEIGRGSHGGFSVILRLKVS